jgi:hypothetical protein
MGGSASDHLIYAIRGLMTDDEWAYFEPFLIRHGGRPPRNHRRVLDAVFWLMRTGASWRDLPDEFGNWNSIFRQFRRWANSGTIFAVGDLWRFGIVALLLWVVFAAVEANSLLAVFAAPLLMGLWMCAVVVIDRWIQSRHPK